MAIHQIRLAGPWELLSGADVPEVTDVAGNMHQVPGTRGVPHRCQLPFDASFFSSTTQNLTAKAVLCRGFHTPTGLSESTEVSLIFVVNYAPIRTFLNNLMLEPTEMVVELLEPPDHATSESDRTPSEHWYRIRASVTPLLKPFNQLIVELNVADQLPKKLNSVTLQIQEFQPGRSSLTKQQ